MKILQLCHKPPFPLLDGGCIAMNNIAAGLIKQGHEVKVIAISTPKHPVKDLDDFKSYREQTNFESVFVDTTITFNGLIKSFIKNESYHINRFDNKQVNSKLIDILTHNSFDIVQIETIFMAPYIKTIRMYSKAKIVVRLHNIEHQIWQRLVQNETHFLKRITLKWLTNKLKNYEMSIFQNIDGFMAISSVDYHYFNQKNPYTKGSIVPFGIEIEDYQVDDNYLPSDIPELFHVGSMNWLPNIEGIEWFIKEVWPMILEQYPSITFTIAGRNIPTQFYTKNSKNLKVIGEVENAKQFMLSKDIMIVPLLSGSGIRIKIIEGMALGKTIITTTIGAEGLDINDGVNILIANTPQEFLEKISLCVNSPEICKIIGENARNYVALHHHNNSISNEIISFYNSLLN